MRIRQFGQPQKWVAATILEVGTLIKVRVDDNTLPGPRERVVDHHRVR